MSITLGLDLGPNSIGWALVDADNHAITAAGVRIFPEGVDNFDSAKEKSRNEDRRIARGMRRQIQRRARRKRLLRDGLIEAGLWPKDEAQQQQLIELDPYALRAQAADESKPLLTPHEMGRLLLHLGRRRGFLSNRNADTKDKESSDIKAEIGSLRHDLQSRDQTLGAFLHDKASIDPVERSEADRVRRRHTAREMYQDELLAIAKRHPTILTDKLLFGRRGMQPLKGRKPIAKRKGETLLQAAGLHGLLFFQRALYWPKSMIGLCELEPKEPRCPRMDRRAQRFCLLQEVNNLKFIDTSSNEERFLDDQARKLLLDKLSQTEKLTFDKIADMLGKLPGMPAPEQIKFNLEKGKRTFLKGHVTDVMLARKVKRWHKLPEDIKTAAVDILVDPARDEDEALRQLTEALSFTQEEAQALLTVDLPDGYIELSRKALAQGKDGTGLLAAMEKGMKYQAGAGVDEHGQPTDAIHAAGYMRRDELVKRALDKLPDPQRMADAPIGDIPNPVVRRTLVELRKLVNAIIREHGKPDAVHIEMARDVKQGERQRKEYSKKISERAAIRDDAADKLREHGVKVTRDAINRYILWQEQEQLCIYSGRVISFTQLYNGETDVDHILPYSRCLDDSQMNKVVCFRDVNAAKGQQTPYEWCANSQPGKYEQMCQRARKMDYSKYRRFLQKELELDTFIARQLVDTSYIARATAEYLKCLFSQEANKRGAVLGLKGQLTAELRHQWGLNNLLNPEGLDVKSREDHRHHALDAILIALTHRSRLQQLGRIHKTGGVLVTGESLDLPWEHFRKDVQDTLSGIHVSHRAARKVAGGLHEETNYAPHRNDQGKIVENEYVVRKPVDALSANEIPNIRDVAVRAAIIKRLMDNGFEVGRGKKIQSADMKKLFGDPTNPVRLVGKKTGTLGPPIRKVRVIKKEQTIRAIRAGNSRVYVKPGSTHHLSFFKFTEQDKVKYEAIWTTMLEAADRLKQQSQLFATRRQALQEKNRGKKISIKDPRMSRLMQEIAQQLPLITRRHPDRPEAQFLFSLSRGEMVLVNVGGKWTPLIYNTSASTTGQLIFHRPFDARPLSERKKNSYSATTLCERDQARKITIDYLGRVRWAND